MSPQTTLKKIKDVFPDWMTGAIFAKIGFLYPTLEWATVTADVDYIGAHSGHKIVSPLIDMLLESQQLHEQLSSTSITALANLIYNRFHVKWEKLYHTLSLEYNPIENYSMIENEIPNLMRTATRSEKTHIQTTASGSNSSDVYAFNSATPSPQSESQGNSTQTVHGDEDENGSVDTETQTGTRQLARSGNIGVTTSQQMLQSEIDLWQWNFFEQVYKDVDSIITIKIY